MQNCEIGFSIPAIAMANPDAQTFTNCGQSVALQVLSYNMHGFYNGLPLLKELCNDGNISLIAVQEHWLSCDKLHLLNTVHEDYVGFGISGMKDKLSSGIYRGRPFGGVGFIWRKSLADRISVLSSDADGRCLIIGLRLDNDTCVKMVNVYFPCYSSKLDYKVELGHCLGFIEDSVSIHDKAVIMGDMNFECQDNNAGYVMCNTVFSNLNISCCDNLCQAAELKTYCNDALGCSSFIDHFFVSDSIKTCVASVSIIDSGCNLSDHRPIVASSMFTDLHMDNGHKNFPSKAPTLYSWRWDKSDLNYYYDCSRASLGDVTVPSHLVSCVSSCCGQDHSVLINHYYGSIVDALQRAADAAVIRIPVSSLKPYWNEHLDQLKRDSMFWHSLWQSAGRPHSGTLFHIQRSCKAKFKNGVRAAYVNYESRYGRAT